VLKAAWWTSDHIGGNVVELLDQINEIGFLRGGQRR
jgi:hypothetical protein